MCIGLVALSKYEMRRPGTDHWHPVEQSRMVRALENNRVYWSERQTMPTLDELLAALAAGEIVAARYSEYRQI